MEYPILISLCGNACMLVSLSMAGPLPFLPIVPFGIPYFMIVLGLAALGTTFMMCAVFSRAKRMAEQKGFPADIRTLLIISGNFHTLHKCKT